RHTINAQLHLAHATLDDVRTEKLRVDAMRELGRALALNPDNQAAFDTLMRALTAAPGQLPPEAEAELAAASRRDHARREDARPRLPDLATRSARRALPGREQRQRVARPERRARGARDL